MKHYADRLDAAVRATGNACLLGLDPHLDLLPAEYAAARDPRLSRAHRADLLGDFCCELIDLAAGRVPAVKPQSAFFELFGSAGARVWERVVLHAHTRGLLVVGDVKRGDIASTAAAYAQAYLVGLPGTDAGELCDAITINPMLGPDTLEPFIDAARGSGAGLYVLLRTSNPGSGSFQAQGSPTLSARIADTLEELGSSWVGASGFSSLGAVVGATHPQELAQLRARLPRTPFLLPGYGAQGAGAREIAAGFVNAQGGGALVASSRAVGFAWKNPEFAGLSWQAAAGRALERMISDVRAACAPARV